jgi:hypothetical protein
VLSATKSSRFNSWFQILPCQVALVVGDWSAKDGSSDVFASEVSAAVSAASAAAASAGLDTTASNNFVSLTVLHHVLSGCPVSSRHAAVTHLPCLTTQFTLSHNASEDDAVLHRIVSAAAVAVLSIACSAPSSPLVHPLTTANHIISSAASRIGNTLFPFEKTAPPCITRFPGLDVAVVDILPALARSDQPCTTFHKLAREHAPGVQPSAAMCLVTAAVAAAARCSGCVAVAVGSMLLTPQPLSAVEMVALLCCDIEHQLRGKLGQDRSQEGRVLHILQHVAGSSGKMQLNVRSLNTVGKHSCCRLLLGRFYRQAACYAAELLAAFWCIGRSASHCYCGRDSHRCSFFRRVS